MRTKAIFSKDADNTTIDVVAPLGAPIAKTYDATINTATDVTLNTATTYFEVHAIDKAVFLRYAATASSTNFDALIDVNSTRGFAVPSGVTVISVIEESATGKVAIFEY